MNLTAPFHRTPVSLDTNNVAVLRPNAGPVATSVADEGCTPTTTATATSLVLVDGAGRMLVDQNGNLIISFAGNT